MAGFSALAPTRTVCQCRAELEFLVMKRAVAATGLGNANISEPRPLRRVYEGGSEMTPSHSSVWQTGRVSSELGRSPQAPAGCPLEPPWWEAGHAREADHAPAL